MTAYQALIVRQRGLDKTVPKEIIDAVALVLLRFQMIGGTGQISCVSTPSVSRMGTTGHLAYRSGVGLMARR
jgi:Holliday junction resolvasome RuvABC ATP-dependent DNA helicase subunit